MDNSREPGMVPETRLDLEVEVLHEDGKWHAGFLEHWRRRDGLWQGFVRYSVGVGMQHIGWFDHPNQLRGAAPDTSSDAVGPAR